jgi:hypothetical protein
MCSAQGIVGILSSLVLSLTTIAGAADCTPPPSGLIAWWPGDTGANDIIGEADGTLMGGATIAPGLVNGAFDLLPGGYVSVRDNPVLDPTNAITVEAWINTRGQISSYGTILRKSGANGSPNQGYSLEFDGPGVVGFWVYTAEEGWQGAVGGSVTSNEWVHLAGTYDGATLRLYENGVQASSQPATGQILQSTYPLNIGRDPVETNRLFNGFIDEVSLYNRALSASEIAAIYQAGSAGKCESSAPPIIIDQPTNESVPFGENASFTVLASGAFPLAFQWSFGGTNIDGATNATLTLTDIQSGQVGNYAVAISNLYGSTNSAFAVLTAYGVPPFITSQPTNQSINVGAAVSFNVTAAGTPPFAYQWRFDGTNIEGATNATLTLASVQLGLAGDYSVHVANGYGSTNSVAAVLTVNAAVPCAPPPAGLVAWWPGDTGANDIIGGDNGTLMGGATIAPGLVNGAFDLTLGGYVSVPDAPALDPTNAISVEAWINTQGQLSSYDTILRKSGANGSPIQGYSLEFDGPGVVGFWVYTDEGGWQGTAGGSVTPNEWIHLAGTYDGTTLRLYENGVLASSQPVTGRILPSTYPLNIGRDPVETNRLFNGFIDEVSFYNRALAASEIAAIYQAGSAGKCPLSPTFAGSLSNQTVFVGGIATFAVTEDGTLPFTYQWSFDGTNLDAATNATLTITNVQLANAGNYTVQVSNAGGVTNGTAILTVVIPPTIAQQPQSLSVSSFGSASFGVAARGTGPLIYQWQKNGTNLVDDGNLTGSATTNLVIGSVSPGDAGNYQVVVTSPYASTNSAVAVLTVPESVISLGSASTVSGTTITVPVILNALGVESAFIGSVAYDPTKLVLQSVEGATPNYSETNSGFVGFGGFAGDGTFSPGSNTVAQLVFVALPVTNSTPVNLVFTNQPKGCQLTDLNFDNLPAVYESGVVLLTPAEYYADVYPRFNGDHQLTLQDWQEEGRMVAGLDVPTNSDEFLRADCAPRGASDGELTVADWVQAGRYALGLDTMTIVTPPANAGVVTKVKPKGGQSAARVLQVSTVSAQRGQKVSVPISLICATNENAVGLTISYNANQLQLLSFTNGAAFASGRWNVNTNQAGKLGLAVALSPGAKLSAGTNQVGVLTFSASGKASGTVAVTLDSTVVKLQTADLLADSLLTTYISGAVVLPAQPTLEATMANGQLQFTWPLNTGTFQVQVAGQPTGPWTTLTLPVADNGANATAVLNTTNQQQYFRLTGQ